MGLAEEHAEAMRLAGRHKMVIRLVQREFGKNSVYSLEHQVYDWRINLQPDEGGGRGRIWHDPKRKGPKISVPRRWTLLDAVQAAVRSLSPDDAPPLAGKVRGPK